MVSFFGGGTNLLITDKGIRGLVVILKQLKSEISITKKDHNEKIICAKAGELLSKVCQFAVSQSLSGLEFCAGIPGTLGGAVMMNAGTKSKDMSHVVESIEVLDQNTLKIDTIKKQDLDFSYRQLNHTGNKLHSLFCLQAQDVFLKILLKVKLPGN